MVAKGSGAGGGRFPGAKTALWLFDGWTETTAAISAGRFEMGCVAPPATDQKSPKKKCGADPWEGKISH